MEVLGVVLAFAVDLVLYFGEDAGSGGAGAFAVGRCIRDADLNGAGVVGLRAAFGGHKWNFTETFADIEPESWGGTSVAL